MISAHPNLIARKLNLIEGLITILFLNLCASAPIQRVFERINLQTYGSDRMEPQTTIIPLQLDDGTVVNVEATLIGEQPVAAQSRPFKVVTDTIRAVAREMLGVLQEAAPDKASIKFGLEVAVESGELTALIVKGTGKGNLEITLEWNK